MEFHQLRYFVAIVRHGSFTRAAEHEHVAQPSVSEQIRKLEEELGAPLFDRRGRRVRLTPPGERFLVHAQRILADLDGARQEVEEALGSERGRVALGAIPTVAPYLLPRLLAACAQAHPGITVTVKEELTSSLVRQLSGGEIDLALMSFPVTQAELTAEPLFEDRMLLAVSRHHRLARRARARVSLHEVAGEPFLLLKDGHCFRNDVLEICKNLKVHPQVVFEGGQFDTLVAMAAAGAGVTLLPAMARDRYRHVGVKLLEFLPPQPARTVGVARLTGRFQSIAARAFFDVLKETCKSGE